MRVEIWTPPEPAPPQEPVLRLRLIARNSSIELCAVDESGERVCSGSLLGFKNGEIIRYRGVNDSIGLKLDAKDRVIVGNP